MNRIVFVSMFIVFLALSPTSNAFDYQLSGFGTASYSCFTNDHADYLINDQPEGAGRSQDCDWGIDSMLGIHLDFGLNDHLNISLQSIVDRNSDRNYTPELTVARLSWAVNENLVLRFGRMPTPTFLHSDNRQIRFALPWVRTPLEIYNLLPTASSDGVEFIYSYARNGWQSEIHSGLTFLDFDSPLSNTLDTYLVETQAVFINLSVENINTLIKLSYLFGYTTIENPLARFITANLIEFAGSDGKALANDLEIDDSFSHMISFGIKHETEYGFLLSEFSHQFIDGFFRDQYGAYLTIGLYLEKWTPYATVSRRWTKGKNSDTRAGTLFSRPVSALLNATRFDNTSLSLGLAYSLQEQVTLKFQSEWIIPDDAGYGLYFNHDYEFGDPRFNDPGNDFLFTLSLDFIF